jgi:hypothetical protein
MKHLLYYSTNAPFWGGSTAATDLRKDTDVSQLRSLALGVFISATPTIIALPLMQSRILGATACAMCHPGPSTPRSQYLDIWESRNIGHRA